MATNEPDELKNRAQSLEKYQKKSEEGRTGIGITAEGDMLAALGLRYGSKEATVFR